MKHSALLRLFGPALLGIGTVTTSATVVLDAAGGSVVDDLKEIASALHNYADANGKLPGAHITGVGGTPLLSWRVAILPYLGEADLYAEFDLTKPWDAAPNLALLNRIPEVFRGPFDSANAVNTHYVGGSGAGTLFEGAAGFRITDVTDGTSNTLLVGESQGSTIPWTAPSDIAIEPCPALPALNESDFFSSLVADKVPFAFADGSVRFLDPSIQCETLYSLFVRNDGGPLNYEADDYVVVNRVPEYAAFGVLDLGVTMSFLLLLKSARSMRTKNTVGGRCFWPCSAAREVRKVWRNLPEV